ncbi:hypothetical protein WISP_62774 [Willisornis vidua]|uniref:Uncharacterized protein n=1 Tax=Willisornis vidua TaxID=1566151 RepID=A0ABQ9DFV7_9PASS|nr:hypothetical protein WISP_62774 [Willisornis vidua]
MQSQGHGVSELRRATRNSCDVIWAKFPAQTGSSQSTWHKVASRRFLNVSSEGNSTTSLGNLFQWSVTRTLKFFLIFWWNFLCISFYPLPLALCFGTTEKSLGLSP